MPILTAEERVGQVVGDHYRLHRVLSGGGMGILFEAIDETTGSPVAVKMIKPVYAADRDRVARFLRETKIAARLSHPNVARVFDVALDENEVPFLVMELLQGRSLEEELCERGVLPPAEALDIVLPIADALESAHAAGVVHRDVKPANIFLSRNGTGTIVPKLLDFGIAKPLEDEFETQSGLVMGTPGYMAPEQAQRGECSPFTDIWAVGAVLYRCLSGRTPHSGRSVTEVLVKLVKEPVPALSAAGVNRSLCATIDRALARDPERRYSSMASFIQALESAAGMQAEHISTQLLPILVAPSSEPEAPVTEGQPESPAPGAELAAPRGRGKARFMAFAVAGLTLVGLSVFLLSRPRPQPARTEPVSTPPALAAARPREVGPTAWVRPIRPSEPLRAETIEPSSVPSARVARVKPSGGASSLRSLAGPKPAHAQPAASARPIQERERTTGLPVATEW